MQQNRIAKQLVLAILLLLLNGNLCSCTGMSNSKIVFDSTKESAADGYTEDESISDASKRDAIEAERNTRENGVYDAGGKIDETSGGSAVAESENPEGSKNGTNTKTETIYIDVCGQVKNPGVYALPAGSRVYEAIERAGGVTDKAEVTVINQAQMLSDGQQIYVPSKQELEDAGLSGSSVSAGTSGLSGGNPAGMSAGSTAGAAGVYGAASLTGAGQSSGGGNTQVNVNTASQEQLMTLSGIGESRAKAIIKYRESNGKFSSTEELMNVSGIGEGIFEKIKDDICI